MVKKLAESAEGASKEEKKAMAQTVNREIYNQNTRFAGKSIGERISEEDQIGANEKPKYTLDALSSDRPLDFKDKSAEKKFQVRHAKRDPLTPDGSGFAKGNGD